MREKGFVLPIVIIAILLVVTALGGLFYYRLTHLKPNEPGIPISALPKLTPTPALTPTKQPTSDLGYSENSKVSGWKLYKNVKYNFSFEYPSQWIFEANDGGSVTESILDIHIRNKESNSPTQCPLGFAAMEIQVGHQKTTGQSFEVFVNSQVSQKVGGLSPSGTIEKLTINGKLAYKIQSSGWDSACKGPGYFIEQSDTKYAYVFTGRDEQNGVPAEGQTLTKIVNSISFL